MAMRYHKGRSWPAGCVLGGFLVACVSYAVVTVPDAPILPADQQLAELEQLVMAGNANVQTWREYGDALSAAGRASDAAAAYDRALKIDPYDRETWFACAMTLAESGDDELLESFLGELVIQDAKLAVEVFDRPEVRPYLSSVTFRDIAAEARCQALD